MVYVDFVFGGLIDDVDVVCGHVCCCYACGDCGDLVVLGKCVIMWYVCRWPNGVVVFDVVFVAYLVVIIVVIVDTCCCCVVLIHGDILVLRNYMVV